MVGVLAAVADAAPLSLRPPAADRHRKQSDQASPKHKQLIEKAPKGRDGLSDAATSGG